MIIKVDEEGRNAITQLCDLALKAGGIQNLNGTTEILNAISIIGQKEKDEKEKEQEQKGK